MTEPKTTTADIPQPQVGLDERCYVQNYRTADERWETGVVKEAEFKLSRTREDGGWWHYTVVLDRQTPVRTDWLGRREGGRSLVLYVSDAGIAPHEALPSSNGQELAGGTDAQDAH
jgi:hypothetical protein